MKIYFAARWERRDEIRELVRGLPTTSRWLSQEVGASGDLDDIRVADCLCLFTEKGPFPRGGRMVEFGYALALGKRMIVIGPDENIFTGIAERYDTFLDALPVLCDNDAALMTRIERQKKLIAIAKHTVKRLTAEGLTDATDELFDMVAGELRVPGTKGTSSETHATTLPSYVIASPAT